MTPWKAILIGVMVGYPIGAGVMWGYFVRAKLIRTREEYYAAKKADNDSL